MPIRSHNPFEDVLARRRGTGTNPFVQKLAVAQEQELLPVAFGPALKDFPGKWREKFKVFPGEAATAPLVVEIGCHYGHTLTDLAKDNPDILFAGIDITFKRVTMTAERATKLGLKNVLVVLANAHGLEELFHEGEANGFVTFFPDPWTKQKHAQNRLYAPKFCNAAHRILSNDGFLWLKTDQEPYFLDACEHAAAAGFEETKLLPILGDKDYSSAFMRRYELQGLAWHGRKWIKNRI